MMKQTSLTLAFALAFTVAGALMAPTVSAQQATDYSKVEIKTNKLADNFYTLDGQGGTVSVLAGNDGVFVVDTQFAPLTEKLVAAIRSFSDKPIRFVVNTHLHGDHTGGNANFAALGATIFAHDGVRNGLQNPVARPDGTKPAPAPAAALPVVTFDGPVTFHLNGETIRVIHLPNAHTNGDVLVHFVQRDILAVGDYFRSVGYPVVDLANGGSLKGTLDGLNATIALAGPKTKIVPGHGQVTDRAALITQRDQLIALRDIVAALVAQGKSVEEVIAARPTADFDARVPQGAQSSERFLKWLYADLKASR
jgi:glyoxylase-like metal-dependent hydrolase (beta-lactamase superfamily II)